jgi:hypothetical protein
LPLFRLLWPVQEVALLILTLEVMVVSHTVHTRLILGSVPGLEAGVDLNALVLGWIGLGEKGIGRNVSDNLTVSTLDAPSMLDFGLVHFLKL